MNLVTENTYSYEWVHTEQTTIRWLQIVKGSNQKEHRKLVNLRL